LLQVAGQIRADVRKEKSTGMDLRFNIAGGTRLMSSAALLVCILEGIPATYVHDETYRELALPLLRMTYGEGLTRKQREVLAFLVKNHEKSFSETALARALGVHKATMNHHLRKLESMGTIERQADPADGRRLRSFEPSLQSVRVNPFDFGNCLQAIENVVEREREKGPVRISATGGTKILTTAAILAAFHEGVEAWYCDPDPIRLPILRGVR